LRATVLVGLALCTGLALRLYQLGAATMGHNEMYVPLIPLPSWVTYPIPLLTFRDVVTFEDIHPPGIQFVWFPWLKVMGTSITAIRLPSVIFGVLMIPAAFVYARRYAGLTAAVVVAFVIALHGNQVFWSQQGRHWVMTALCALVSTLLLGQLEERWNAGRALAFALVAGLGMWSEYAFWPIIAAQVLWVALRNAPKRTVPTSAPALALTFVLSAPLSFYLLRSLGLRDFMPRETFARLLELLQFGQLIDLTHGGTWHVPGGAPLALVLGAAGALALVLGLRAGPGAGAVPEPAVDAAAGPWLGPLIIAALLADLFMVHYFGHVRARKTLYGVVAAPWVTLGTWLAFRRIWSPLCARLPGHTIAVVAKMLGGEPTVVVALAPVLALVAIEFGGKTVIAQRNLLLVTPLMVVLMVRGLMQGPVRALRGATVAGLLALAVAGGLEGATRPRIVRDYKGLAERIMAQSQPGDLYVIQNIWYATPVHYYLRAPDYHLVPPAALSAPLPPRVWVIDFGNDARITSGIASVAATRLPGYRERSRVRVLKAGATLFASAPEDAPGRRALR
jgi:hypothetical protein